MRQSLMPPTLKDPHHPPPAHEYIKLKSINFNQLKSLM